jgi:hypothetical protein
MNNNDKMLRLVLSDSELATKYKINALDFVSVEDALESENPVIVVIAKVLKNINITKGKSNHKEIYNELYSYLNKNLI